MAADGLPVDRDAGRAAVKSPGRCLPGQSQEDIQVALERVVKALKQLRLHAVWNEFEVQARVAEQLDQAGMGFQKEFHLGKGNRPDFFLPGSGIVVEVKKGKPNSGVVSRQLHRYGAFEAVRAVVLVVEKKVHDVPRQVHGKPVRYVPLRMQWGVAL